MNSTNVTTHGEISRSMGGVNTGEKRVADPKGESSVQARCVLPACLPYIIQ